MIRATQEKKQAPPHLWKQNTTNNFSRIGKGVAEGCVIPDLFSFYQTEQHKQRGSGLKGLGRHSLLQCVDSGGEEGVPVQKSST